MSQETVLKALYRRYRVPGSQLPRLDELAADVCLCHSVAYNNLKALRAKGLVTWDRWKSRTFRLTRAGILAAQGYKLVMWRGKAINGRKEA